MLSLARQSDLLFFDDVPYNGLKRVISGGQDGVDIAGLYAAFDSKIEVGGHCPRFYRTCTGQNLELRDKFNLEETESTNYQRRTELNVQNSDGTICLASDFGSPGEVLTQKFIKKYNKHNYNVKLPQQNYESEIVNITKWIMDNQISILNVAGNRDKDRRFGFHFNTSYDILMNVFKTVKERFKE